MILAATAITLSACADETPQTNDRDLATVQFVDYGVSLLTVDNAYMVFGAQMKKDTSYHRGTLVVSTLENFPTNEYRIGIVLEDDELHPGNDLLGGENISQEMATETGAFNPHMTIYRLFAHHDVNPIAHLTDSSFRLFWWKHGQTTTKDNVIKHEPKIIVIAVSQHIKLDHEHDAVEPNAVSFVRPSGEDL